MFLLFIGSFKFDHSLNTQHHTAISISKETDAVVVVVSEENGRVSLVERGRIRRDLDEPALRSALLELLVKPTDRPGIARTEPGEPAVGRDGAADPLAR